MVWYNIMLYCIVLYGMLQYYNIIILYHTIQYNIVEPSPLPAKRAAGREAAGRGVLSLWFVLCLSVCLIYANFVLNQAPRPRSSRQAVLSFWFVLYVCV